jgi:hypothetical protein
MGLVLSMCANASPLPTLSVSWASSWCDPLRGRIVAPVRGVVTGHIAIAAGITMVDSPTVPGSITIRTRTVDHGN